MAQSNFSFLSGEFPLLFQISSHAEQYLHSDPAVCLFKLRQFCEILTSSIIELTHINTSHLDNRAQDTQFERINLISRAFKLDPTVTNTFHQLRKIANRAVHSKDGRAQTEDALACLKASWYLSRWFYRAFGKDKEILKSQTFVLPQKQPDSSSVIEEQKKKLQAQEALIQKQQQELLRREEENRRQLAQREQELIASFRRGDFSQLKDLSPEASAQIRQLQKRPDSLNETDALSPYLFVQQSTQEQTRSAALTEAEAIAGDEALARRLIDEMLRESGWQAGSTTLTYAKGARPLKGVDQAIAEYPVAGGRADYVLFHGLMPLAVLEAKRSQITTAGKIGQAERYSAAFDFASASKLLRPYPGENSPWPARPDGTEGKDKELCYQIPFVLAANGAPYYDKDPEHSGTWFRDLRSPSNLHIPIGSLPRPEDLAWMLVIDRKKASAALQQEPLGYLRLRPYQEKAVKTIEQELSAGRTRLLVSMATGTGKTLVARALIYRLLKAGLFRRVLFLVDRLALAEQAFNKFDEDPLEGGLKFSQIYNVNSNDKFNVQSETRVQIATVQGLVSRLDSGDTDLSSGMFDCIIVDEAHRNYTQDKDAGDNVRALLTVLGEQNYLASYRRALNYFTAAVVGFTATPSAQSLNIFGQPVYTYSYRDAVLDNYLVDYNPPVVLKTELSDSGIYIPKGTEITVYRTKTGRITTKTTPADLDFKQKDFNIKVKSESYNEAICRELAADPRIDPNSSHKTLIFCYPDSHADEIKRHLDRLYKERLGDKYDERAVQKITGKSDNAAQLIRDFAHEKYPSIAITVDLLTTGVDVPKICNLVFLRFIESPVLYQQMLGRATRLCPEINKDSFNIFDAVGVTELNLQDQMLPLEASSSRSSLKTEQLAGLLSDPKKRREAENLPTELGADGKGPRNGADDLALLFALRLFRLMQKAHALRHSYPEVRELCRRIEQIFNCDSETFRSTVSALSAAQLGQILAQNPQLPELMEQLRQLCLPGREIVISDKEDHLKDKHLNFEEAADTALELISSLKEYILQHQDSIPDLKRVLHAPWELSQAALEQLRAVLFDAGFRDTRIRSALDNQKLLAEADYNLIDALRCVLSARTPLPLSTRLDNAATQLAAAYQLDAQEQKILNRLAAVLKKELIFDEQRFNRPFAESGGLKRARKTLNGKLDELVAALVKIAFAPTAVTNQPQTDLKQDAGVDPKTDQKDPAATADSTGQYRSQIH